MSDPRELKKRVAERLLALDGVHAVAVGGKTVDGRPTGELAIRIFTVHKRPLEEIPEDQRIPPEIEGVPTDVVEEPIPTIKQVAGIDPTKQNLDTGEHRPIIGGSQIVREGRGGEGTLGCLCRVIGDPKTVIALTCHHVIYKKCSDIPDGEEVGQPTSKDSCSECCSDIFGTVLDSQCDPDVDITLIKLKPETKWVAEVLEMSFITGTHTITDVEAAPHTYQVRKRGRSSKLSGGHVTDVDQTGTINNHDGTVHRSYTGATRIEANPDPANPGATTGFSLAGDSGAAVVNDSDEIVGILFGGGVSIDFMTPIEDVIAKFKTGLPATRQISLEVAIATALNDVQTVPAAMVADGEPERAPLRSAEADRLEEELRSSPQGAWYADLYDRHMEEVRRLVNTNRRVTVVWHRSGAAELFQWVVRAFTRPGERIPEQVGDRPALACLHDLAAVLGRYGSAALQADLQKALPTFPDIGGLRDDEIIERLRSPTGAPAPV